MVSVSKVLLLIASVHIILYAKEVCAEGSSSHADHRMYMLEAEHHERTPRLEDFFWTGSGDGPPAPSDPPPLTPAQPSDTLVRTTTVLATVYLDSYPPQPVTDGTTGECVANCGDPSVPESLEPEIPDDRRYWLLTVIQGSTPDSLQLRLARLYQKAFLRQQERHLGIIKSLDAPPARKKHDVHSFIVNNENGVSFSNAGASFNYHDVQSSLANSIDNTETVYNKQSFAINISDTDILLVPVDAKMFSLDNINTISSKAEIKATKLSEIKTWILVTPTVIMKKREVTSDREELSEDKKDLIDIPLETEVTNETVLFKREIIKPDQQPPVHVHIQNITELTDTGTVKIVYVVLVGGRAVPAAVAARDMRLVRDAEVATELGAVVTTKAEPAYLKAAEGLSGEEASSRTVQGTELWALAIGGTIAVLLLLVLLVLLCRLVRRKKALSAASLRVYRNELMREVERNQLKQVHEEKDGKLISVVSPSRTRPSSTLLPIYRTASATSSTTTSSGVSEMAAAVRRRQKKPHTLRMPQKKRVGTTDSLLMSAGVGDSSDSAKELSAPATPTSYLSMPSVRSFPRGNIVEPLSRVLEPISVRHLDIDSPIHTPKSKLKSDLPRTRDKGLGTDSDVVPRRQMSSQLVRLGSIDKDPGVVGPLVWDLHCQRIKEGPKPNSPTKSVASSKKDANNVSRMRQRFNELVDDAFSLFGSPGSSPKSGATYNVPADEKKDTERKKHGGVQLAQARNDNVKLPGSPYTALDTIRGRSAGIKAAGAKHEGAGDAFRPRTSIARQPHPCEMRSQPARAWDATPAMHSFGASTSRQPTIPVVNPALILSEGRLPPGDPALPLISAIKSEIQRVRDNTQKPPEK